MGYRFNDAPPPNPEDTLPRFFVRNGATTVLAFPCFYIEIITAHSTDLHDHLGWPRPDMKDGICQYPHRFRIAECEWADFKHPIPIDLLSDYETYDSFSIVLDNPPQDDLAFNVYVMEDEPNVIYVETQASFDLFEDETKEFRFTLFAHAPATVIDGVSYSAKKDVVIRGIIVVLPGRSE